MKRWIWFIVSILISTGVYFTIRYGLRPKAIPVMNATEFEELQQIGAVVYKRLRQEVRAERVVLLGSATDLEGYSEIWQGFLKSALAERLQIDVLYQRDGLNDVFPGAAVEKVPFTESMVHSGDLVKLVKARIQAGRLVVIHGPTAEISHMMKESLSRSLDEVLQRPVLAVSSIDLGLKPEEQSALQTQCLSGENPGQIRLECAEWKVGRALLKKKPISGKIWAVMEQHGLKEFLIFVHR